MVFANYIYAMVVKKEEPLILQEDTSYEDMSTKRNNTRPIFCGPPGSAPPIVELKSYYCCCRLHDALHATGPDFLCNTTVRTQSIVTPPRSPPRAPPHHRPCANDNHQNDTAVLVARQRADRLFCTRYSVWPGVFSGAHTCGS